MLSAFNGIAKAPTYMVVMQITTRHCKLKLMHTCIPLWFHVWKKFSSKPVWSYVPPTHHVQLKRSSIRSFSHDFFNESCDLFKLVAKLCPVQFPKECLRQASFLNILMQLHLYVRSTKKLLNSLNPYERTITVTPVCQRQVGCFLLGCRFRNSQFGDMLIEKYGIIITIFFFS